MPLIIPVEVVRTKIMRLIQDFHQTLGHHPGIELRLVMIFQIVENTEE